MEQRDGRLGFKFLLASIPYFAVLLWAGWIYSTNWTEPSGVQFAFLPFILAPGAALAAAVVALSTRHSTFPNWARVLPFLSVILLLLPALGVPLTDQHAVLGLVGVVLLGAIQAIVLGQQVLRR